MNERQMSSLSIKGNGYFRVQRKDRLAHRQCIDTR